MAGLASINVKFQVDLKQFSSEMQNSLREIDKFGQKMQSVGRGLTTFITAPVLLAGAASVKFASDIQESNNKVEVAFGASSAAVKEFSKTTLENYGISKGTSLEMSSLFGDMSTSMGLPQAAAAKMSTSLVALAGDLASFKNIGLDQAQTALKGIFTGEMESLKQLGVIMSQAALQEYAYSQGIRTKIADMSEAEKVQLRYNFVMAKTTNAQGDFARTGDSAANQMKNFQEVLKEISTNIGEVILPIFTKIITKINEWLKAFNSLSEGTRTTIVVVAGIAAAMGPLALAIGAVSSAIPAVVAGFKLMGVTSAASLGPITAIIAGLAAVAYVVVNNWEPIKKTLVDIANYFVDLYNNSMVFRAAVEYITLSFKNVWAIVKMVFNNVIATIAYAGNNIFNFFKTLGGLIKSVLTLDMEGFKRAISSGFADFGKDSASFFKKMVDNGKGAAIEIGGNISTALSNTLDGNKIKKIVVPKDKVDATAVAEAVNEAVQSGAAGKGGKVGNKKVSAVAGDLKSKGLETIDSKAEIKVSASNIVDPVMMEELAAAAQQIEIIQAVAESASAAIANAFSSMSSGIVQSMGLANDGFQGFAAKIIETGFQLISMLVQQVIKNIAIRQAEATANAVAGATASGAATGPGAIFTTPAFIATAVGGVLAAFAAIPKFEFGGIAGGSSYFGDKILARINSKEMITNEGQQKNIWNAMNSGGAVNVTLGGGFVVDGNKLRLVLDRTEQINKRTR